MLPDAKHPFWNCVHAGILMAGLSGAVEVEICEVIRWTKIR